MVKPNSQCFAQSLRKPDGIKRMSIQATYCLKVPAVEHIMLRIVRILTTFVKYHLFLSGEEGRQHAGIHMYRQT